MFELGVIAVITAMVATVMFGALIEKLTTPNPKYWVKRYALEQAEARATKAAIIIRGLVTDLEQQLARQEADTIQHRKEMVALLAKHERHLPYYLEEDYQHWRRDRGLLKFDEKKISSLIRLQAG